MTALDKLKEVSAILKTAGIEDAPKEAEILITETLGIDRTSLYSGRYKITEDDSRRIDSLLQRRLKREPLQYIFGHVEFLGLRFNIGRGVLIPRPETEMLAEEAIRILKSKKPSGANILDLCTGSGCIATTIARHLPESFVYGVDISEAALSYAEENALLNDVRNVRFLRGDLYEPLKIGPEIRFDMIISNPPYIRSEDIKSLQPEIRDWEPLEALNGGEDGLEYYRRIIGGCRDFLMDKGEVLLEVGDSRGVIDIARSYNMRVLSVIKDLSGIDRVLRLSLNHS
ncbi:MAG: peptide chain release factor N(5)-glutamine methyltransferase [Thermodesulfovibrionales bacterium]